MMEEVLQRCYANSPQWLRLRLENMHYVHQDTQNQERLALLPLILSRIDASRIYNYAGSIPYLQTTRVTIETLSAILLDNEPFCHAWRHLANDDWVYNRRAMKRTPHSVIIIELGTNEKDTQAIYEKLDNDHSLAVSWNASKRLPHIGQYLNSIVVQDEDYDHTLIVTGKITQGFSLKLISVLPTLFTSTIGDMDRPLSRLSDEEKEYLQMFFPLDPKGISDWLDKYFAEYDFRSIAIEGMLSDFADSYLEGKILGKQDQVTNLRRELQNLKDSIAFKLRQLETANIELSGLLSRKNQQDVKEAEREIIEFLKSNKCLTLNEFYNHAFKLTVKTTLSNFNQDLYETMRNNPRGSLLDDLKFGENIEWEDGMALMDAIFLDETVKVKMYDTIELDFNDYSFHSTSQVNDIIVSDHVLNPHLHYYNCWGANEVPLIEALEELDYLGAMSMAIAAVGNLSVGESINMKNFLNDVRYSGRCFILPDGEEVDYYRAIEWASGKPGLTEETEGEENE